MLAVVHPRPPTATHRCGSLVMFEKLSFATRTPLMLVAPLKLLGPLMVPAMTWFPVTSGQVVDEHNGPLTAFGGTNGCVPPQVPPPLDGGTAGYWAMQPAGTGVLTLLL